MRSVQYSHFLDFWLRVRSDMLTGRTLSDSVAGLQAVHRGHKRKVYIGGMCYRTDLFMLSDP